MGWLDKMSDLARLNSIDVIMMTPLLIDAPMAEKLWIPGVNYTEVNEKLKTLRSLMLEYGKKNGVRIIDAQNLFLQFYTEENVNDYFIDGLHPTVLGHEAIARFLPDSLRKPGQPPEDRC